MTIERTRELLGEDVLGLTDDKILVLIQERSDFCEVLLEMIENQLLTLKEEKYDNKQR